jgi:hypothetical protein
MPERRKARSGSAVVHSRATAAAMRNYGSGGDAGST